MKSPQWRQNVLVVSDDTSLVALLRAAFGPETRLVIAEGSQEAIEKLDSSPFQVLIVDTKTTDPKAQDHESEPTSFLELSQYGAQLNQGLTIILLVRTLTSKEGNFARKCGATLIMDRKSISLNRMVYVIRVLRKRTFRTLLARDFATDQVLPTDIFYYLSLNDRYVVFLQAGTPFTLEKKEKFEASHARHLYVREAELAPALSKLRKEGAEPLYSEALAAIYSQYRQLLMQFFDTSSDGALAFGKKMLENGFGLVRRIDELIQRFPEPETCLRELPYPRWSTLAHGINSAIYALIFARHCGLSAPEEIAFGALVHNIGHSELDQKIVEKGEAALTDQERAEYRDHVNCSLDHLRKKQIPLSKRLERTILYHHENHDGSGFPEGLSGDQLPKEAALLSVVGSFDYLRTVRSGERPLDLREAWSRLKQMPGRNDTLSQKYHPDLLRSLDEFFKSS